MKVCGKCGGLKSFSEFHWESAGKDRPKRWSRLCKDCKKARFRVVNETRRTTLKELWQSHRKNGCGYCGEKNPTVITYHHIDKKREDFNPSAATITQVQDELAKCVALCANCHMRVHAGEIQVNHLPRLCVKGGHHDGF